MAEFVQAHIHENHPAYVELSALLDLAAITWPRYGLSAADLSRLDEYTRQLILLKMIT